MSFVLSEDQQMLRDTAMAFARDEMPVTHLRALRDGGANGVDAEMRSKLAELGFFGVLVPEVLETCETDNDDDLHRSIIACLLAQVAEPEITLNAAARQLAWSGDKRFERYRQTDARGNQRASRTLREMIAAACRQGICIVTGPSVKGFTCNERASPIVLRRFERPSSASCPTWR